MSKTVLSHIRTIDEAVSALRESFKILPDVSFTITIESEDEIEDLDLPPEEVISRRLVDEVKKSEEAYKAGRFIECSSKKERDDFFKKIWSR